MRIKISRMQAVLATYMDFKIRTTLLPFIPKYIFHEIERNYIGGSGPFTMVVNRDVYLVYISCYAYYTYIDLYVYIYIYNSNMGVYI